MKPREIFLNALERKPTPRPAVGSATSIATMDLMDKTGCVFPDAHLNAETMSGLAEAGYTVLGLDNIMPLFSVWHESAALGIEVDWGARDRMPASEGAICKIGESYKIPPNFLASEFCRVPLDSLSILKKRHGTEAAIVGKVFGPWTLGYHVYGVEEFLINTILQPDEVKRAIETLKEVTIKFALAQIEAGADALCLADHATRDLCSPETYKTFLLDIHSELRERIPCPLILHICGDTADRIGYIAQTGIACFHFDSKVPAEKARELAGEKLSLMGGTSNFEIIRKGTPELIAADVKEKIDCRIDIIGPECAVPLDAPYTNIKAIADELKNSFI